MWSFAETNVKRFGKLSPRKIKFNCFADKADKMKFIFFLVKRYSPTENVDLESNEQKTPLHLACLHGHVETVRTLLEYNANPNYKSLNQITPLHLAAIYGRIDVIKILVKYGGKLNNRDSFHMTPLHRFASQ